MRVFEHREACPAPCGGGTVTRSMRRVANATLLRFDRYNEPPARCKPNLSGDAGLRRRDFAVFLSLFRVLLLSTPSRVSNVNTGHWGLWPS